MSTNILADCEWCGGPAPPGIYCDCLISVAPMKHWCCEACWYREHDDDGLATRCPCDLTEEERALLALAR